MKRFCLATIILIISIPLCNAQSSKASHILEILTAAEAAEASGQNIIAQQYYSLASEQLDKLPGKDAVVYKTRTGKMVKASDFIASKIIKKPAAAPQTVSVTATTQVNVQLPIESPPIREVVKDTITIEKTIIHKDTVVVINTVEKVVEKEVPPPVQEEVRLQNHQNLHYLVLGDIKVVPDIAYGAMFCVMNRFGGYVKASSNFNKAETSYTCLSNGETLSGKIWTTGKQTTANTTITAGACFNALDWLTLYAGAGYGMRKVAWEDFEGRWAEVTDVSFKGLALDAGIAAHLGHLAFGAGIGTTAFGFICADLTLGVYF